MLLDTNYKTLSTPEDMSATDSETRWLVQIHPMNLEKNRFQLGEHPLTLGRSSECDLVLEDPSVSRQHAQIRFQDDSHIISDLGSTNRVRVNDRIVDHCELRSGDRIQLGDWIFRYLADNDVESQFHETVYSMMTRDALTTVFNKRYLIECLDREVARCFRHQRNLAIVLLDIDHFKAINDTHGHLVGDEVLRELARRLSDVLREDEIFARFGGEEFAIVNGESSLESATELAERCRAAIGDHPFETSAGEIRVTISLGVEASIPDAPGDRDVLVQAADEKLYQAKALGRNQVCFQLTES